MNLSGLRAWIRRQAPEIISTQVSDAQLNALINEGYQQFAARTGCFIRDITVNVTQGATVVEMPAEVHDVISITQGGTKLLWAFITDMELIYGANWRSQSGTPVYAIKLSPTIIRPVPVPSAAQTWTVEAVIIPIASGTVPLLSSDTDTPKLPEDFHLALAYYAMQQLALMNPQAPLQVARAQQYWANFIELVETAKQMLGTTLKEVQVVPLASVQQARE